MTGASVSGILKNLEIAPTLVEMPEKRMQQFAKQLANAWLPSLLLEDHDPNFQPRLATAISEGIRVVLVVQNPSTVSSFLYTIRYAEKGITHMVPVDKKYVEIHEAFRICCVLKKGVSTFADEWRRRLREGYWLYKNVE